MRILCVLAAMFALSSFSFSCKSDDEEEELPEIDCDKVDVPKFEDVMAFDTCTTCHAASKTGSARMSAPTNINFDTEAAAQMQAMKAAEEVNEGAMPPADAKLKLTQEEKDQLFAWALCSD